MLEVDGRAWRTVPDEVVLRVGLAAGRELDRPLLRRLRVELARSRATGVAARALERRDLSRAELEARLGRAHVAEGVAAETIQSLERAGLVDDARVAHTRASALADRGYGDAAIVARLETAGVAEAATHEAVEALPPERERARELVARIRDPRKAARLLQRRGFDPELVGDLVVGLDSEG